ncbi:DUF2357 domain-containing protein [Pontiellaceae bacterium B1224]|nr:DUF2357 domain-containing protein [Pontiellaceae bacterium B1224]
MEYNICIGDRSVIDEADGQNTARKFRSFLEWPEKMYFESARGFTDIHLEERLCGTESWQRVGSFSLYVLPTKLGEERYETMTDDLQSLCGSLLLDLLGTSRWKHTDVSLSPGVSYRSKEEELRSLKQTWAQLRPLLDRIHRSPTSIVSKEMRKTAYWGMRELAPRAARDLARRGVDPRNKACVRPFMVDQPVLLETSNTREHQVLAAFLIRLQKRLIDIAKAISQHDASIQEDRAYRDISVGSGPTLYQTQDLPRLQQLELARKSAEELYESIDQMRRRSPFVKCKPLFEWPGRQFFTQGPILKRVRDVIDRYLSSSSFWVGNAPGESITKLSSRMYEQWVLLRLVEDFRGCGLEFKLWDEALQTSKNDRFTIDFERGLTFEVALTSQKRMRIRYEPWILPRDDAKKLGETLCHGNNASRVPWCPDIMIECFLEKDGHQESLYGVAVDCKYTSRIVDHHWNATRKYMTIRSTSGNHQVVRQLWLAYPGLDSKLQMMDPSVTFDANGPSCSFAEKLEGIIPCMPGELSGSQNLTQFAEGLVRYFRQIPIDLNK